jgi:hypothetical protein
LPQPILVEKFFQLAYVIARFAPFFPLPEIAVAPVLDVNALFAQSFAQSHPNMPKHPKEGQLGHS